MKSGMNRTALFCSCLVLLVGWQLADALDSDDLSTTCETDDAFNLTFQSTVTGPGTKLESAPEGVSKGATVTFSLSLDTTQFQKMTGPGEHGPGERDSGCDGHRSQEIIECHQETWTFPETTYTLSYTSGYSHTGQIDRVEIHNGGTERMTMNFGDSIDVSESERDDHIKFLYGDDEVFEAKANDGKWHQGAIPDSFNAAVCGIDKGGVFALTFYWGHWGGDGWGSYHYDYTTSAKKTLVTKTPIDELLCSLWKKEYGADWCDSLSDDEKQDCSECTPEDLNGQGCAWVNTLKCGEACQKNKCNDKSARECNWDNGKCHDADASKCSEQCTNDPCCGCDDSGNEFMSGCPAPPMCANGQEARAPKGTCCAGPQDCECPMVMCKISCENGWAKGKDGCDTCKCAEPEKPKCSEWCENSPCCGCDPATGQENLYSCPAPPMCMDGSEARPAEGVCCAGPDDCAGGGLQVCPDGIDMCWGRRKEDLMPPPAPNCVWEMDASDPCVQGCGSWKCEDEEEAMSCDNNPWKGKGNKKAKKAVAKIAKAPKKNAKKVKKAKKAVGKAKKGLKKGKKTQGDVDAAEAKLKKANAAAAKGEKAATAGKWYMDNCKNF